MKRPIKNEMMNRTFLAIPSCRGSCGSIMHLDAYALAYAHAIIIRNEKNGGTDQ